MFDEVAFKLGHEVYVHKRMSESDRHERISAIDGVGKPLARVIGFEDHAYGRIRQNGIRPGVYRDQSWALLEYLAGDAEGCVKRVSVRDLVHRDKKLHAERMRCVYEMSMREWRAVKETYRMGELPDTPFWEGDLVESQEPDGRPVKGIVVDIDYDDILGLDEYSQAKKRESPGEPVVRTTPAPHRRVYGIARSIGLQAEWYVSVARTRLVERGNVWRLAHGKPLVFRHRDFVSELEFRLVVGQYDIVRQQEAGFDPDRGWDKHCAVLALQTGAVHWFLRKGDAMFGRGTSLVAIRFHDESFALRASGRALAGLTGPTHDFVQAAE